jgi:hypothetical protein
MILDRSFVELNRASSKRMRELVMRLSNEQLRQAVVRRTPAEYAQGFLSDWTVSSTLAHIAFWDVRVMHLLDATERAGKLCAPEIDISVNDILGTFFMAIPPRLAGQMAFQAAEALDEIIEKFPSDLLEEVYAHQERWVVRALHRHAHLDKIEAALKS